MDEDSENVMLKELDLSTKNILRNIIVPLDNPYWMGIIPSKELIFVADESEGKVNIINASSSLEGLKIVDSVVVANDTQELISSPLNNKIF